MAATATATPVVRRQAPKAAPSRNGHAKAPPAVPPEITAALADCHPDTRRVLTDLHARTVTGGVDVLETHWQQGRLLETLRRDEKYTRSVDGEGGAVNPMAVARVVTGLSDTAVGKKAQFYRVTEHAEDKAFVFGLRTARGGKPLTFLHVIAALALDSDDEPAAGKPGSARRAPKEFKEALRRAAEEDWSADELATYVRTKVHSRGKKTHKHGRAFAVPPTAEARADKLIGLLEPVLTYHKQVLGSATHSVEAALRKLPQEQVAAQAEPLTKKLDGVRDFLLTARETLTRIIEIEFADARAYIGLCSGQAGQAAGKSRAEEAARDD